MTDAPPVLPPAGWYAEPQNPQQQRWWTGAAWGEHVRPTPAPYAPAPSSPTSTGAPQPDHASEAAPGQTTFDGPAIAGPEPVARRGFFDSPFERPGTPRNTPGTLSLVFALLPFAVIWWFAPVGLIVGLALAIASIVFGIVGIARARRIRGSSVTAIVGLIVGVVALMASLLGIFAVGMAALVQASAPTNLEVRLADSVRTVTGEPMRVDCPGTALPANGTTFTCTGRDSSGTVVDITVTMTSNDGAFEWVIGQQ